MTIKCPYCGAAYSIAENECGCRARCEACGKRFVIGHVATSGRNHLGVSKGITSDGLWHNNSSKSRWKGAWHSLWICSIIGLVVFTWVSSESEKGDEALEPTNDENPVGRSRQSPEKRLGMTHIPPEKLNVQEQQHDPEADDDAVDNDTEESIVALADLIVQKRQKEDLLRAEKVKVAEQKQQRQMELFLAEMKRNGGNREAAWEVANASVKMDSDDLVSLTDSLILDAKNRNDPSLIRDFEASFQNHTGISLSLKTDQEEKEQRILTRALEHVKARFQRNLRLYGLSESDLPKHSSDTQSSVMQQLVQDRMRIEAYKREMCIGDY